MAIETTPTTPPEISRHNFWWNKKSRKLFFGQNFDRKWTGNDLFWFLIHWEFGESDQAFGFIVRQTRSERVLPWHWNLPNGDAGEKTDATVKSPRYLSVSKFGVRESLTEKKKVHFVQGIPLVRFYRNNFSNPIQNLQQNFHAWNEFFYRWNLHFWLTWTLESVAFSWLKVTSVASGSRLLW